MTLTIDDKTRVEYNRSKGHVYIDIPIIREGGTNSDRINFMYDTGAYITVINREMYEWYGLNKFPRRAATMGGYVGSTPGYIFQVPGMKIGKRLLLGVWAFTPKSKEIKQNLLGDNVIEYFRPLQDNQNDCFYFIDNLYPEPYMSPDKSLSFACDKIMIIEEMEASY
ncbi:MAG: retroviral-like aspartic protease family protein [Defluviitaleaceae bacterium]|nr:retroviral-like aspartic protease family protein [Defluviitaleaceae bacterium]MCL2273346.1 retroviral-like aspartic protease family protein [Defluviitaleaceae bacterium]